MTATKKPAGNAAKKIEWTRHRGGRSPIKPGTEVEVRLRDGQIIRTDEHRDARWSHLDGGDDIMAWRRVRKPRLPKAEPVAEPVRHFDRSDEPKRPYTEEISHPLADQLDPTTPARPAWDEHLDGDRDGLGCARGVVWSVAAILAVALLAVILRGCVS